jgi:hypothetical protein
VIFLVFKIFAYLAVALGLGAAGGWLLRNLVAMRQEEALNRQLIEARGRVPQLESQIRGLDEKAGRLTEKIREKDTQLGELTQSLNDREGALLEKERALALLQARLDARHRGSSEVRTEDHMLELEEVQLGADVVLEGVVAPEPEPEINIGSSAPDSSRELLALKDEVNRLNAALEDARTAAASTPHPASVAEKPELLERIAELEHELERARRALLNEQRRVTELERERELQNRTLQVLHQQLEMAKEARRAAGS